MPKQRQCFLRTSLSLLILLTPIIGTRAGHCENSSEWRIHAAFALTGIAASWGSHELNGATLAIEEWNQESNRKRASLILEDTQSSNLGTINAIQKLGAVNGAKIILGPSWIGSFQGVLPIAEKEKIFLMSPSSTVDVFKKKPSEYPLVFSTWFTLRNQVDFLLSLLRNAGRKKVTVVSDQDQFFEAMGSSLAERAPKYGIELIRDSDHPKDSADFRSSILKIKKEGVDALVLNLGSEQNMLNFLRQRRQLAVATPLFGTEYLNSYAEKAEFRQLMGGLTYFVPPNTADSKFVEAYKARFNTLPLVSASNTYDATKMLLEAFSNDANDPYSLRKFLLSKTFNTSSFGEQRFNEMGSLETMSFVIKTINSN